MSHTPGPWQAGGRYEGGRVIADDTGRSVADAWQLDRPIDELKANAALIASAPDLKEQRDELLAALEAVVYAEDNPGRVQAHAPLVTPTKRAERFRNARAAIAKAKGAPAGRNS